MYVGGYPIEVFGKQVQGSLDDLKIDDVTGPLACGLLAIDVGRTRLKCLHRALKGVLQSAQLKLNPM